MLDGPAQLIDAIERSLFGGGVITQRVDSADPLFTVQPGLIDAFTNLQAASGLLVLLTTVREGDELTARIRDRELITNSDDQSAAITAVHQLLHEEKILFDTERAGL